VRIPELLILRAMVENAEFYETRVAEALSHPTGPLVRELHQAGKALEIETSVVPQLLAKLKESEIENWKQRVAEILSSNHPDQGERVQTLVDEGAPLVGVEPEMTQLRSVLKFDQSLKWKKRVLSLLESGSGDLLSLRDMLASSKGLDIEENFIQAIQERIDTLGRAPPKAKAVKREAPVDPLQGESDSPKKKGKKKGELTCGLFFLLTFLLISSFVFFFSPAGIHCVCRDPDGNSSPMIECSGCEEWFHMSCVNLTPERAARLKEYNCAKCTRRLKRQASTDVLEKPAESSFTPSLPALLPEIPELAPNTL